MRAHLVGAMIAVAVTAVAVTGLLVTRTVDAQLAASSRRDLRLSALSTAQTAAAVYVEAGGWTPRSIRALHTVARSRGDAIVVLGADGRAMPESRARVAPGGVRAAVVVRGERVGTVVATHGDRVGLVDRELTEQIDTLLVRAALLAGALALLVALGVGLRMARPLQRLTDIAGRMEAGELESPAVGAVGAGGSREMRKLARTMDRLAAALRRQDEVRRATAADVSHELRGALVGVFTRIDALQEGLVDDEATTFAQLERDARRLRRLVCDVHRLTEAQRPALFLDTGPIALDDLVGERVAAHADQFRARSIALAHATAPARVVGDPERLAQVLDNLLSNALRYTDPGGRVVVRLDARGGDAVIAVADSGIGIAPEYLARVFDRFWRAPGARARAAEGSGVGLAVVSELVRAHGGTVEVSSRPGNGTSFRIRLPLADRPADAAAPHAEHAPGTGARERRRPRVVPRPGVGVAGH